MTSICPGCRDLTHEVSYLVRVVTELQTAEARLCALCTDKLRVETREAQGVEVAITLLTPSSLERSS